MNEKIEEIAKAIRDQCQRHGYLVSIPEGALLWVSLARTAVSAMRDPTEEMLAVGIRMASGGALCSWQAMNDEVLK